nr:glycoside hydrolase family 38 C-terminal domain-containing protein [Candidatus Sigynarchaeum springense]
MKPRHIKFTKHQAAFLLLVFGLTAFAGVSTWFNYNGSAERGISAGYKVVFVIPHTHLDPWWLDPWHAEAERWSANVRNALDQMRVQEDMCFVLDQVVAIKYFWEHYPDYQQDILRFIREGRLEIVQGFVSQPEVNIAGEIGLIQDAAIGIKWTRDVLGAKITTGWEIDVFGFGAGTPTYYNKLGLNYSIICRTGIGMWDGVFNWTGVDGSRIYGYKMPHYDHGYGNDGQVTATDFTNVNEFMQKVHEWIRPTNNPFQHTVNPGNLSNDQGDMMMFYGSDFSNPNWELPGFVKAWNAQEADKTGYVCKIGTPKMFFDRLGPLLAAGGVVRTAITPARDLNPVFSGYYTSRVNMKNYTRFFEHKLTTLETFGSIAKQSFPAFTYPEPSFEQAWYKACASHHHDSITGTSRQAVYEDNMQVFYQEMPVLRDLETSILGTMVDNINTTFPDATVRPAVLFNPMGWERTEPVEVPVSMAAFPAAVQNSTVDVEVIDPDTGNISPSQVRPIKNVTAGSPFLDRFTVSFLATVPATGYKTYFLRPLAAYQANTTALSGSFTSTGFTLDNTYYTITFNATGNNMLQIRDKDLGWNVLDGARDPWQLLAYNEIGNAWIYDFRGIQYNVSALVPQVVVEERGPARIHVKLCYATAGSEYNRSIILADGVKRVEFKDEMDFLPHNATALAVRFAFNVTRANRQYDAPFGFTTHDDDGVYFPALYHVTVQNSTRAASWVNYGIHGYRRVGNQLEGVLVRSSNNTSPVPPDDVTSTDHGYFNFSYCITTFDPSVPGEANQVAREKLGYAWNFPVTPFVSDGLHAGTLPKNESYFSANDSRVLSLGLRKAWGENGIVALLLNAASASFPASITTSLGHDEVMNATFLNDATGDIASDPAGFNTTIGPYGWQSVLVRPHALDINGPRIGALRQADAFSTDRIALEAIISDAEGSAIQAAWLEYCFNETFEGQAWTSVSMSQASPGKYRGEVALDALVSRPVYLRVRAIDASGNVQVSRAWTVLDKPALTDTEVGTGAVLAVVLVIFVLCLLATVVRLRQKAKLATDARPAGPTNDRIGMGQKIARFVVHQVAIPLLVPMLAIGTWVSFWLVSKGYFGSPAIEFLNPGYDVPGGGVGSPWTHTIRNNLFDFFVPGFFIGTIIVGTLAFIVVLALPKQVSMKGRVYAATIGAALAPVAAYAVLPVLLVVGSAPASYWSQLGTLPGFLYSLVDTDLYKVLYWFVLPLFAAAIIALLSVSLIKWTWNSVFTPSMKLSILAGVHQVNKMLARTWTRFTSEIKSKVSQDRGGARRP